VREGSTDDSCRYARCNRNGAKRARREENGGAPPTLYFRKDLPNGYAVVGRKITRAVLPDFRAETDVAASSVRETVAVGEGI